MFDPRWKKVPSLEVSTDAVVHVGKCLYFGFVCAPEGSEQTINIYDSAAVAGASVKVEPTWTADSTKKMDGHEHTNPVLCKNGLTIVLSGGKAIVYYQPWAEVSYG